MKKEEKEGKDRMSKKWKNKERSLLQAEEKGRNTKRERRKKKEEEWKKAAGAWFCFAELRRRRLVLYLGYD